LLTHEIGVLLAAFREPISKCQRVLWESASRGRVSLRKGTLATMDAQKTLVSWSRMALKEDVSNDPASTA